MNIRALRERFDQHPLYGNRAFRAVFVFLAGFIFDVCTLDRIDSVWQTAQQILFFIGCFLLIRWEIRETRGVGLPVRIQKYWQHKDLAIQFLLGGLLSAYLLFYFKSAAIGSALVFVAFMSALLILNEFVQTERFRVDLHLALFSMSLTSFWVAMIPTVLGSIRNYHFYAAIAVSSGTLYLLFRRWVKTQSWKRAVPIFGMPALLLVFYFLEWIPPVPLAVKSMGVYRSLEKRDGKFFLTSVTSPWQFWRSGDQVFSARPGDRIVLFMRVFAPARFEDQLLVVWRLHTTRGLETLDRIPLTIVGGRTEGFRGYVTKAAYVPGDWIASLQTADGREVGRMNIEVRDDPTSDVRQVYTHSE